MALILRLWTTAIFAISFLSFSAAFQPKFAYGTDKVRGVNLGGWLIIQPWITPSLFDATGNSAVVDEYTYTQLVDRSTATKALESHWDTFINESDFKEIAEAGLNHVRIPIGYWAFDVGPGEPYIQGQLPYLVKAVAWAEKYDLKVVPELYGAPGTQDVGDGQSGHITFNPQWASNQTNVDRTDAIIKTIVEMFGENPAVAMIGPLAKPAAYLDGALNVTRKFWLDSYESIRYPNPAREQGNTVEVFSWSFLALDAWTGFMTPPAYEGVVIEYEIYNVFTETVLQYDLDQHIAAICAMDVNITSFDLGFLVSEWTTALTDCAPGINGRGNGAQYDGTYNNATRIGSCEGKAGDASTFSAEYMDMLRKFWEAQVITYEKGLGWIMWTWKTASEDWSYKSGLKYGWIPLSPTDLEYPDICGES